MSTPIRIKRSSQPGKRPTTEQLQLGELAFNFNDGHLYSKRDTAGVGIGTTTALLTPWLENFGGASIYYDNAVGIGSTQPTSKLDVDGDVYIASNLVADGTISFTGISTFNSDVDINASVDISDHLVVNGNLNVVGLSTFGSDVDINANVDISGYLDVDGHTELDNINVSGVSTFVGVGTFQNDLYVGGDLYVADDIVFDEFSARNASLSGNLEVSGVSTFTGAIDANGDLDVDGHTELDNLNVSGVATFAQNVEITGNLTVNGTQTILNTTQLEVEDINIGIASADPKLSNAALDGAGITIYGAAGDKTLTWNNADSRMEFNTDLHAPNISSTDLTLTGDLDVDGHTELDNVNISGVTTFASSADFNASIDVDGHTELDDLNVSGVSTFASAVDINADLDVDGRTELDATNISETLNVVGVSTFASDIDINASIDVDGHTELDNLNVSGVSTFAGAADFNGGVDVLGHTELDTLNVSVATTTASLTLANAGVAVTAILDEDGLTSDRADALATQQSIKAYVDAQVTAQDLDFAGDTGTGAVDLDSQTFSVFGTPNEIETAAAGQSVTIGLPSNVTITNQLDVGGGLAVTGVTTLSSNVDINADIDVDGHTELDNVNISGVTTFAGAIDANGDLDVDGFAELDAVNISQTLSVTGISTFSSDVDINAGLDVDGHTELDNLNVSGVSTFAGAADFNGNIDVDGHTELDDVNVTGVSTFQSDVFLGDNNRLRLGDSQDFQIYHDSTTSQSRIEESGGGSLIIKGTDLYLQTGAGENILFGDANGAVNLYYDATKKFETTGYGVTIYNELRTPNLNVSGASTFTGAADFNGGLVANEATVEDLADNSVVIAGAGGRLEDDANLTFDGSTLSVGVDLDVDGHTELDQLRVVGVSTFAGNVDISAGGNLTVAGNLTVNGTQTILNTSQLEVEDINIGIASADPKLSNAALDGAGITIHGAAGDKTLTWSNANSRMEFNTDLYAPNIDSTNITLSGDLDVDGHTELDNLNVSGVSTFAGAIDANGDLDVDGHTELDNVNISGVTTFAGAIDANGDLDVDGFTELDAVNVSQTLSVVGISTFSSSVDINADIDVDGHTELDNLNVSGVSTFASTVDIDSDLDVDGFTELDAVNVSQTLSVVGLSTFGSDVDINASIDVSGHTELDTLNVSVATTTASLTLANAGVAVTAILDEDGLTSDRADALATQQSIKAYVDAQVTAQDLDFAGDTGTGAVDLDSQSLTISGTANEIETSATGQTLTVGLPNEVAITTSLTVGSATTITGSGIIAGIVTGTLDNTLTLATSGTGLSGSATYDNSGASTFTVTSNATDANTGGTIVARDGSGNFSAGTISADLTGVASTATKLETARDFSVSGDVATSSGVSFDGTGNVDLAVTLSNTFSANTSGIITSTGGFVGDLTGVASTATKLETARDFSITGSFVTASAVSFDGTGNVALGATITPDSITLGTYTSGDYVESITGTANEVEVTGGTGEGSTPQIGLPANVTISNDLIVSRDVQINRDLNVTGNITIGGTTATLFTETLTISDAEIVLGFRTDAFDNDASNDTTANHGGIAVASTEGTPLVRLVAAGIETLPPTYKKILWFKARNFLWTWN
jgi:hypothetical protein